VGTVPEGATPGFLVWLLSMKWRVAVDRAIGPLGLTHAQYALLGSLYSMGRSGRRPSQRELADYTGLEPLYVSKLARTLEAAGLIERVRDPADTRAVQLSLTAHGRAVTRTAIGVVHQLHGQLLAPLGGLGSARTEAFAREVRALLEAPIDPPAGRGRAAMPAGADPAHDQHQRAAR
jgi:DNA-binding MarR family transcriptional regulator